MKLGRRKFDSTALARKHLRYKYTITKVQVAKFQSAKSKNFIIARRASIYIYYIATLPRSSFREIIGLEMLILFLFLDYIEREFN